MKIGKSIKAQSLNKGCNELIYYVRCDTVSWKALQGHPEGLKGKACRTRPGWTRPGCISQRGR